MAEDRVRQVRKLKDELEQLLDRIEELKDEQSTLNELRDQLEALETLSGTNAHVLALTEDLDERQKGLDTSMGAADVRRGEIQDEAEDLQGAFKAEQEQTKRDFENSLEELESLLAEAAEDDGDDEGDD